MALLRQLSLSCCVVIIYSLVVDRKTTGVLYKTCTRQRMDLSCTTYNDCEERPLRLSGYTALEELDFGPNDNQIHIWIQSFNYIVIDETFFDENIIGEKFRGRAVTIQAGTVLLENITAEAISKLERLGVAFLDVVGLGVDIPEGCGIKTFEISYLKNISFPDHANIEQFGIYYTDLISIAITPGVLENIQRLAFIGGTMNCDETMYRYFKLLKEGTLIMYFDLANTHRTYCDMPPQLRGSNWYHLTLQSYEYTLPLIPQQLTTTEAPTTQLTVRTTVPTTVRSRPPVTTTRRPTTHKTTTEYKEGTSISAETTNLSNLPSKAITTSATTLTPDTTPRLILSSLITNIIFTQPASRITKSHPTVTKSVSHKTTISSLLNIVVTNNTSVRIPTQTQPTLTNSSRSPLVEVVTTSSESSTSNVTNLTTPSDERKPEIGIETTPHFTTIGEAQVVSNGSRLAKHWYIFVFPALFICIFLSGLTFSLTQIKKRKDRAKDGKNGIANVKGTEYQDRMTLLNGSSGRPITVMTGPAGQYPQNPYYKPEVLKSEERTAV